jgi:hypothetical protein
MSRPEHGRGLGSFRTIPATLFLLVVFAAACSGTAAPRSLDAKKLTPATAKGDPRARLEALGDAWFRTSATITYRTTGKVPGQPVSSHQCLRQLVETVTDRLAALRKCSRQGRLKLTWEPPDRWRMDVTSPVDSFRILSTADGSVFCHIADRQCRSISTAEAKKSSPFGFLFISPHLLLDAIGARDEDVVSEHGTELAGVGVECFAASGSRGRAEWCYSRSGGLLSFLGGEGDDLTTIEAISVSSQVFEGAFELPGS